MFCCNYAQDRGGVMRRRARIVAERRRREGFRIYYIGQAWSSRRGGTRSRRTSCIYPDVRPLADPPAGAAARAVPAPHHEPLDAIQASGPRESRSSSHTLARATALSLFAAAAAHFNAGRALSCPILAGRSLFYDLLLADIYLTAILLNNY
ncbi:hypothetical protein T492DRAFT_336362 [Pavlovales sp. CCMP2436]|nr:hypothetical protein T492DRAFT_336362 [Pavlovales sp. CCMP2436]